jgi:hypothetical protein
VAICPPPLGRVGGKIEASTRCCNELFACCATMVQRMLFTHWYISPTPSVEGASNASRSVATMATFWLVLVKVGRCRSTHPLTVAWPASSTNSQWSRSASLASVVAHLSVSTPRCCMALHSMSSCRACRHSSRLAASGSGRGVGVVVHCGLIGAV